MALPPDRRSVVNEVFAADLWDLTTKAGCGCFTERVAFALHRREPGEWFHLKKNPGQNQWNGHAVDAILHASGYAVDIIGSSASPAAKPSWHVDKMADGGPRYADRPELFLVPTLAGCAPAGPQPGPEPEPPPDALAARVGQLELALRALEARVLLQGQPVAHLVSNVVPALEGRILALEERPAPVPELPALVAEGWTSREWGHGHRVSVPVRRADE